MHAVHITRSTPSFLPSPPHSFPPIFFFLLSPESSSSPQATTLPLLLPPPFSIPRCSPPPIPTRPLAACFCCLQQVLVHPAGLGWGMAWAPPPEGFVSLAAEPLPPTCLHAFLWLCPVLHQGGGGKAGLVHHWAREAAEKVAYPCWQILTEAAPLR